MSECNVAQLRDREIVRVSGSAARTFLQGLITNDIDKAKPGSAIYAGLLTPQGKILFDFFVVPAEDGFLLDVANAKAAELMQRLGFYKLRAQVEIVEDPSFTVAASWESSPRLPEGAIAYADPRLPALGHRILLPAGTSVGSLACALATEDDYNAKRIALGVPEGGSDYAYGDAFPHEALFNQLAGVDFKKGCFVGQETTSRMKRRGAVKSRMLPIAFEGPPPPPGTEVLAGTLRAGEMLSGTQGLAMALVRLDRIEGTSLSVDGRPCSVIRPSWMTA